jgi:phospholipase/lecithinase/hemolysin
MSSGLMKARPWRRWLAGGALALVLAACGGGVSQSEPFVPQRMFAFGDESSLLLPGGRKYTVNVLGEDGELDCRSQPVWTQGLAASFGFVFEECNPAGLEPKAFMRAAVGAKVDDLAAQIDVQVAAGGYNSKDLTMVMLGTHDVLELYERYAADPTLSEDDLLAEARERGNRLGVQIDRLVLLGARVIVSTIPDLGLTPYALAQRAQHTDIDRAALLTQLTFQLNAGMRVRILNDGRYIGLVLGDEMSTAMVDQPSSFGLTNVSTGVCTTPLPLCSTATLEPGGSSLTFLWADDLRLAFTGHQTLTILADTRARNNPF